GRRCQGGQHRAVYPGGPHFLPSGLDDRVRADVGNGRPDIQPDAVHPGIDGLSDADARFVGVTHEDDGVEHVFFAGVVERALIDDLSVPVLGEGGGVSLDVEGAVITLARLLERSVDPPLFRLHLVPPSSESAKKNGDNGYALSAPASPVLWSRSNCWPLDRRRRSSRRPGRRPFVRRIPCTLAG